MTRKQFLANSQYGINGYKEFGAKQKEKILTFCLQRGLSAYNEHLKKHTQK